MSNEENVTTFSGFGSWMSTLTPASNTQASVIHELPASCTPYPYENHHFAELPAGDTAKLPDRGTHTYYHPPPNPLSYPEPQPQPPKRKDTDTNPFVSDLEVVEPTAKPEPVAKLILKGLQKPNIAGFFEEVVELSVFCSLSQINEILVTTGEYVL
jgi:hypothetical protein